MLDLWDKITWCALVFIFLTGVILDSEVCLAVSALGLLMYSLYIKLSDQIKALKEQVK